MKVLSITEKPKLHKESTVQEFLLWWLRGLRTWHSICEDVNSILGLSQWVKDPVLPQAAAEVANTARIQCCCGCGVTLSCSSDSTSHLGTSTGHRCSRKKEKKKKLGLKAGEKMLYIFIPTLQLCSSCPHPYTSWSQGPPDAILIRTLPAKFSN